MPAQQLGGPDKGAAPVGLKPMQDPTFVTRERDAAVRQVRELMAQRTRADEQARKVRAELEAVTAQRDAALLCIENLMQEATSLADDLDNSHCEVAELKEERDQLLAKLVELSQQVAETRETATPETEGRRRPGASILNPQSGDALRYSDFASTVSMASFASAEGEFVAAAELQRTPATDYFDTAAEEFFAKVGENGEEPALFLLQKEIPAIEYETEDEILELHHSVNFSYLSAEGKQQESCQGYVCCVNRRGKPLVYAALCGIHTGKTWIFGPEQQPSDQASCTKLIRDALKFAEEVGFLMERVLPGPKAPQQHNAIVRCPVLKAVAGPPEASPPPQERL